MELQNQSAAVFGGAVDATKVEFSFCDTAEDAEDAWRMMTAQARVPGGGVADEDVEMGSTTLQTRARALPVPAAPVRVDGSLGSLRQVPLPRLRRARVPVPEMGRSTATRPTRARTPRSGSAYLCLNHDLHAIDATRTRLSG